MKQLQLSSSKIKAMQKCPATLSPRLQGSRRPLSQSLAAAGSEVTEWQGTSAWPLSCPPCVPVSADPGTGVSLLQAVPVVITLGIPCKAGCIGKHDI